MVCKFCGSYMVEGTTLCPRCGRNNVPSAFSPVYNAPKTSDASPFVSSPTLGGDSAPREQGGPSRVIGMATRPPEPPSYTPAPSYTPTPSVPSYASAPATPTYAPATSAPSAGTYAPPTRVAAAKKNKKEGKHIGRITTLCLFFAVVLGAFWLFSDQTEFELKWDLKASETDTLINDDLDGYWRNHKETKNPERNTPKFQPMLDEEQSDVFTRYFYVPEIGDLKDVELACHFENRLLGGIEMYCEDEAGLKNYFCETFDVDPSMIQDVTHVQYNNTYVVLFVKEKRIFFANAEYGGLCSVFLEPYMGY